MKLKVSKESNTGLNTEFVNIESGRKIKLEQAIRQVRKGTPVIRIMWQSGIPMEQRTCGQSRTEV